MKLGYPLAFLMALAAAKAYSTENDNFDVDGLIANVDKLKEFVECYLGTAPCTDVPANFITDVPDAIKTACEKCNAVQKNMLHKFLVAVQAKLPAESEAFNKKYDPEGKYGPALFAAIAA